MGGHLKRVLITGANGYVARAFIAAFGARYRLVLFGRSATPGEHESVAGDVRNLDDLRRAARGVDAILHLAAVTTDKADATDAEFFETNTVGTFNVLEAAAANGVKKIVYGSSVCAVGFRATPRLIMETDRCEPTDGMYGTSKYLSERLCECYAAEHGIDIICLRTAMVVPQHELPAPASPLARHWLGAVHIDDVVSAFQLALDDEHIRFDVFHIASDGPNSKFDITKAKAKLGYRPSHRLDESLPSAPLRLVKGLLGKTRRALHL